MIHNIRCFAQSASILILTTAVVLSQPVIQFKLPFQVTISQSTKIDTLWAGASGDGPGGTILDNTYGLDSSSAFGSYGTWREVVLPPDPPDFEFLSKFTDFRTPTTWPYEGLAPYDFRGYGPSQIDTFCVRIYGNGSTKKVAHGTVTLSWPTNVCTYTGPWELKKKGTGSTYSTVLSNMCVTTSWTDNNSNKDDTVQYLLIRGGIAPTLCGLITDIDCPLCYSTLNFGAMGNGESRTFSQTIINTCEIPVAITGINAPSGYSVLPVPPSLIFPLEATTLYITCTAPGTGCGPFSGTISVAYDAGGRSETLPIPVTASVPCGNCTNFALCIGWNLVSVPRIQSDFSADVVFPGKFGSLFGFCCPNSYCETPFLAIGQGFWIYNQSVVPFTVCGEAPTGTISVLLCAGWNLIGSREMPIQVSTLIVNGGAAIFGDTFRYDCMTGSYQPTTIINPGEAVWVYVTGDCTMTMP